MMKTTAWFNYLINQTDEPLLHHQSVFFIYFKVIEIENETALLETLVSFFNAQDAFITDENNGVLITHELPSYLDDTLNEVIELITEDFGMHIHFLIGNKHVTDDATPLVFSKEFSLLKYAVDHINYVSSLLVKHEISNQLLKSLYPLVYQLIQEDNQLKYAIQKLWETNSNISQAASELYIHRNTLIYRINKFQKDTHLDLKNPNDLLISYLLTL